VIKNYQFDIVYFKIWIKLLAGKCFHSIIKAFELISKFFKDEIKFQYKFVK